MTVMKESLVGHYKPLQVEGAYELPVVCVKSASLSFASYRHYGEYLKSTSIAATGYSHFLTPSELRL